MGMNHFLAQYPAFPGLALAVIGLIVCGIFLAAIVRDVRRGIKADRDAVAAAVALKAPAWTPWDPEL